MNCLTPWRLVVVRPSQAVAQLSSVSRSIQSARSRDSRHHSPVTSIITACWMRGCALT